MAPAAALGATPFAQPGRCSPALAARHLGCQRRAVVTHARYGSRRRWWSDAWEDEPGGASGAGNLDAAAAAAAEELTTIFCSEGSIVRLGATPRPHLDLRLSSAARRGAADPLPLPSEQGLCIGSIFQISATNGVEPSRRINLLGFCYSTEQLFEQVEGTVLSRGGEVFETQRQLKSGIHECLQMTVAIPLLWGVPPEYERLKAGIKTGGGIIERVTKEWVIY